MGTAAAKERACSTIPQQVYALGHVVQIAPAENTSLVLEEQAERHQGRSTRSAPPATTNCSGSGTCPTKTTSTPTPITSIGPVRSLSASLDDGRGAAGKRARDAPSVLNAVPQQQGLDVTWNVPSSTYKLRYRPAGTREFSSPEEAQLPRALRSRSSTGLRPEPYEVTLKSPEGREGREKIRRVQTHAAARAGCPREHLSAHAERLARDRNRQTRARPDADGRTRQWTNHPTGFTYAWLRCSGLGENGVSEEEGTECEPITSGPQETPVTSSTYNPGPADVARTIAVEVRATNAHGFSVAGSEPELVLQRGRRIRTAAAAVHHPADALRGRRRRAPADRPPRQLGKRTAQLRREVVPLQRPQPRRHRRHLQGDHPQEPADRQIRTGDRQHLRDRTRRRRAVDRGPGDGRKHRRLERGRLAGGADRLAVPPTNVKPPEISGDRPEGPDADGGAGHAGKRSPGAPLAVAALQPSGGSQLRRNRVCHGRHLHGRPRRRQATRSRSAKRSKTEPGAARPSTSPATQAVPVPPSSPAVADHRPEDLRDPDPGPDRDRGRGQLEQPAVRLRPPVAALRTLRTRAAQRIAGAGVAQLQAHRPGRRPHDRAQGNRHQRRRLDHRPDSKPSAVVAGAVPVATLPPTINGVVQQGQTLTADHGSWSNEPSGYAYQWRSDATRRRANANRSPAPSRARYTPTTADVG